MHLGITGSRKGMTEKQFDVIKKLVKEGNSIISHFHHGDCIGVDVQTAILIEHYLPDVWIVCHPPDKVNTRGFGPYHEIYSPKPYLVRDQAIVNLSKYLWAVPDKPECVRSGTWATVRMARKKGIPITIVMPNGEINYE